MAVALKRQQKRKATGRTRDDNSRAAQPAPPAQDTPLTHTTHSHLPPTRAWSPYLVLRKSKAGAVWSTLRDL